MHFQWGIIKDQNTSTKMIFYKSLTCNTGNVKNNYAPYKCIENWPLGGFDE